MRHPTSGTLAAAQKSTTGAAIQKTAALGHTSDAVATDAAVVHAPLET